LATTEGEEGVMRVGSVCRSARVGLGWGGFFVLWGGGGIQVVWCAAWELDRFVDTYII
jgi:hypothetical protein